MHSICSCSLTANSRTFGRIKSAHNFPIVPRTFTFVGLSELISLQGSTGSIACEQYFGSIIRRCKKNVIYVDVSFGTKLKPLLFKGNANGGAVSEWLSFIQFQAIRFKIKCQFLFILSVALKLGLRGFPE